MKEPAAAGQGTMARGLAAMQQHGEVVPWSFERRALRPGDVSVKVMYCGICHTDLHYIHKWAQEFPVVPGHEIVGVVTQFGADVTGFNIGDKVLIGTIVDSCGTCEMCLQHDESYCRAFPTLTYDGVDRVDGSRTRGGYSDHYVADAKFVHHLPAGLDPASAAPLLCAGITTYSPLKFWKVGPGSTVGIIGIGGLGHLAVKFARAMGAHVVAFTRSPQKAQEALALGAHEAVLSTDAAQMQAQAFKLDFIVDTVSTTYDMSPFLLTLKQNGTLCSLGLPDRLDFQPVLLAMGRRSISSSGVGGTVETREMLQFCADHGIGADIELVRPDAINEALARLEKGDVRYRFVLDMTTATS